MTEIGREEWWRQQRFLVDSKSWKNKKNDDNAIVELFPFFGE